MYKKLSIATILLIMMTLTVSFAWMMDVIGPSGDALVFLFDKENNTSIYVSPNNLEINISYEKNGEYVDAYSSTKTDSENVLVSFNNKAPGDVIKFRVKIKNLTDLDITTSVLFSDINTNAPEFFDYIRIGIISYHGFTAISKLPPVEEFCLFDRLPEDYVYDYENPKSTSVSFLKNLVIPPNQQEVEINFYIKIDHLADNSLQNKTFTIGKINFMCI